MSPRKTKKQTPPQPTEKKKRRRNLWAAIVFPFLLFTFVFGGVDAIVLRDPWSMGLALFLVAAINWSVFFPLQNRLRASLVSALLILGMFAVVLFVIPPVRISRETTFLTDPKSTDGTKIDYSRAKLDMLYPKELREHPELNGFRTIAEAFGPTVLGLPSDVDAAVAAKCWNKMCDILQIQSDVQPTRKYQSAESFFAEKRDEISTWKQLASPVKLHKRVSEQPWTAQDFPLVESWLKQTGPVLDFFAENIRRDHFAIPGPIAEGQLVHPDSLFTSFSRDMRIRIQNKLALQNPDAAWADVMVLYRLADHLFKCSSTVEEYFHAQYLWSIAEESARAVVRWGNWPVETMEQRLAEMEPFFKPFTKEIGKTIIDTQRLAILERVQAAAWGESNPENSPVFNRFLRFFHWNDTFVKINSYFDWIELLETPSYSFSSSFPIRGETSEWRNIVQMGIFRAVPDKTGWMEIRLWTDRSHFLEQQLRVQQAKTSLLRSAFYLEMHRREHDGKYPENWDDLKARYGEKIPNDPCRPVREEDRSLRYTATEDGAGYELSSAGTNGISDRESAKKDNRRTDDIVITVSHEHTVAW